MSTAVETLDQEDLTRTQTERWSLLVKVLDNQVDPKVASASAKLLDGIDKQILTRQRIKVDSKVADSNVEMARAMISAIRTEVRGQNLRRVDDPVVDTVTTFEIPEDVLPEVTVIPGATSIGVCGERYDEFQDRMIKGEVYDDSKDR